MIDWKRMREIAAEAKALNANGPMSRRDFNRISDAASGVAGKERQYLEWLSIYDPSEHLELRGAMSG